MNPFIKRHTCWLKGLIALFAVCCLFSCSGGGYTIIYREGAQDEEQLAVRELQRYLYQLTGKLPRLKTFGTDQRLSVGKKSILVLNASTAGSLHGILPEEQMKKIYAMGDEDYMLSSLDSDRLLIVGRQAEGTLYGVYRYLEELGIGFELNGDVLPDQRIKKIRLSGFDELRSPAFATRGILPFHDFPEGPDWWSEDDYKAVIAQLPKMGFNFIGFHNYPETDPFIGFNRAEPQVWLGTFDQFDPATGNVRAAYPAMNANMKDSTWNYYPAKTSDFACGASMLFPEDKYGPEFMRGVSPWPHTPQENIDIFNGMGSLLNGAFSLAGKVGVKTCVGIETPITIPQAVRDSLRAKGFDPDSQEAKIRLFEGIFSRIKQAYPLDYFWLWTPESWTWEGNDRAQMDAVYDDFYCAMEAIDNLRSYLKLATGGWVLGPQQNRAYLDKVLPKYIPVSTINREVGFTPVEPGFADVKKRSKWAIPWIEDDQALTSPQLWAGRTVKDAQDAARYGCDGLLGIHWRTMGLSPAFFALSRAGWDVQDFTAVPDSVRNAPVGDLYAEWAEKQFGKGKGAAIGAVFASLDGGYMKDGVQYTNLPRISRWGYAGPGMIKTVETPWETYGKAYAFIDTLEAMRPEVEGEGARFRFDYWLNTFRYSRAMAHVNTLLGDLSRMNRELGQTEDAGLRRDKAEEMLAKRAELTAQWEEAVDYLLRTVNTPGELGTIANLEMHNLACRDLLGQYDAPIAAALGRPVEPVSLRKDYRGEPRVIVPTKRSLLTRGEPLRVRAMVLSADPVEEVVLRFREPGRRSWQQAAMPQLGRGVYEVTLPADRLGDGIEYYVQAVTGGKKIVFPATAGKINQSVVILD